MVGYKVRLHENICDFRGREVKEGLIWRTWVEKTRISEIRNTSGEVSIGKEDVSSYETGKKTG